MNKNPFVPQQSYPTQPPLPPGPPPPPGPTQDYNAYWAQAAAQAQQHQAQAQPVPYNPQWSAPQPPQARPPPQQDAALYANYGYGGQAGLHWQQQGQRQAQPGAPQYAAPPTMPQAPVQPAYNPYNPAAGYHPPYVPQGPPQVGPMAIPQYAHPQPPPPPPQQYYPQPHPQPIPQQLAPQQQPQQQQQHHQQQQRNNNHLHHTPPHQLPPAKRQRFDGPNHGQNSRGHHQFQAPAQPQFQAPLPAPPQQQPIGIYGSGSPAQNQGHARGGGPGMPMRGGPGGNRGGSGSIAGGRGGRGGSMSAVRGGGTGGRGGRGGSMYMGGGSGNGGRGGGSGQAVPLRGHGSTRGNFGGGNAKDFHGRRGGGSFTVGGHQGVGNSSFRGGSGGGRGQQRGGGRHDGGGNSGGAFGTRDGPMASSFSSNGKKDENRRTLTDFKIIGLEMRDLDWTWGILPTSPSIKEEEASQSQATDAPVSNGELPVKQEATEADIPAADTAVKIPETAQSITTVSGSEDVVPATDIKYIAAPTTNEVPTGPHGLPPIPTNPIPPPPSRIRIYFHTPVSADDSHPINLATSSVAPSDSRKGKRKKLEDDEDEEGREPKRPPPPQMGGSQISDMDAASVDIEAAGGAGGRRGSVAPSVAESASEADWLMAAINEDEDLGEVEAETQEHDPEAEDDDKLDVTQVEESNDTEPDDDGNRDGLVVADPETDGHATVGHPDQDADAPVLLPSSSPVGVEPNAVVVDTAVSAIAPLPNGVDASTDAAEPSPAEEAVAIAIVAPDAAAHSVAVDDTVAHALVLEPQYIPGLHARVSSPGAAPAETTITAAALSSLAEQSADEIVGPDTQVPQLSLLVGRNSCKPLQPCASLASTVPDADAEAQGDGVGSFSEDGGATVVEDPISSQANPLVDNMDAEAGLLEQEHLPEPPASPTSNTLLSTSSGSTYGGEQGSQNTSTSLSTPASPMKVDGKPTKTPSANRLSISYAAGSRRLVIDAGVVEKLRVFRGEGRIEVVVHIERDSEGGLKGIVIEGLSEATKSYTPLVTLPPTDDTAPPVDPTLPTFTRAPIPTQTILTAYLDTDRPLSEPKWVKSGDVQEWLKSMFGRMFWVAGEAADGWERKIEVVDPDPAPTIWSVLEGWASNSPAGALTERQRFLKTHMQDEPENILEILLRLVRGERATPFSGSSASINNASLSGPLLSALSHTSASSSGGGSGGSGGGSGFAHGEQQTHVSLAVLAMWQMTREYARKAGRDAEGGEAAAVKAVEERVGEIIRCLPSHLLYKSLDGMFKEWRGEKKGGRG